MIPRFRSVPPPGSLSGTTSLGRDLLAELLRLLLRLTLTVVIGSSVVAVIALGWPRVALMFSPAKPIVDHLSSSASFIGQDTVAAASNRAGGGADEEVGAAAGAAIATTIGTRPLAIVALSDGDVQQMRLPDQALDMCRPVVKYLPELITVVTIDGVFRAGCEGSELQLTEDWFRWDVRFWREYGDAVRFVDGDITAYARQLALAYDAEVAADRIIATPREFRAPINHSLWAGMIIAGIVAAAIVVYIGLRWGLSRYMRRVDRRRGWEYERDVIDSQLGEIALALVHIDPLQQADAATSAAAAVVDYPAALAELAALKPGDSLAGLAARAAAIRQQLVAGGIVR